MALKPLTAEQKAELINDLTNYYNLLYRTSGLKVPKAILNYAVAHRFGPDANFRLYVMNNDKAWAEGPIAIEQRQKAIDMLISAFGDNSWRKDKELVKLVKAFGVIPNAEKLNQALRKLFLQKVMKSAAFQTKNPGFALWWSKNGSSQPNQFDPAQWVATYNDRVRSDRALFGAAYADLMGPNAVMPEHLFWLAFLGEWSPNDARFKNEVMASDEWMGSSTATELSNDFRENWAAIFGEGVEPPADMLLAYTKGNGIFLDFFHSTIKNSRVFLDAFPDYAAWETKTARDKGIPPTDLDIFGYLAQQETDRDTKASYINDYRELFGVDAMPDQALLDRAIAEKWSVAVFHKYVMQNDPNARETDEYKDKAQEFDTYYKGIFGDNAVPDQALQDEYVQSGSNDTSTMWEAIKGTAAFRQQYANWDIFASAMQGAGVDVLEDPLAYKEYQKGMEEAFAAIGMAVPANLLQTIFASGANVGDVTRNLQTYAQTKQSFDWQTGQEADVATAAGVGNLAAGGDLRTRMEQALAQHRAFSQSKAIRFDDSTKNENIINKI